MAKKKEEKKKEVPKRSIKEIMDTIIDKDALEKRKENAVSKAPKTVEIKNDNPYRSKRKTFLKENFSFKEHEGKIYIHYDEWSQDVFVGPVDSMEDAEKVIETYVEGNGKNILDVTPCAVHSIVIEL